MTKQTSFNHLAPSWAPFHDQGRVCLQCSSVFTADVCPVCVLTQRLKRLSSRLDQQG